MDQEALVTIFRKKHWKPNIKAPKNTITYPSVQQKNYISLDHNYSLQTGYPNTTTKQAETKKCKTCITINTPKPCRDISDYMIAEEIRIANLDDENIVLLSKFIPNSSSLTKAKYWKYLQPYWSISEEITTIDGIK